MDQRIENLQEKLEIEMEQMNDKMSEILRILQKR